MKKRLFPILLTAAALTTAIAPAATGKDLTDIGYVDQSRIAQLPSFMSVSRQLASFQTQLNSQYAAAMRSAHTPAARQRVSQEMQQRYSDEQRQVAGPQLMRVQLAIASVASTKGLSVVVDKRIIIYGGQDVTNDVLRLLQSTQTILPLGTAPPPSEIGFVDQSALGDSPIVKAASAQMQQFAESQRRLYSQQYVRAGNDTQKQQQIANAYNQSMQQENNKVLQPVIDRTQAVTGQVAQRKGLVLVIDHADILYGGTDITADVQNALDK